MSFWGLPSIPCYLVYAQMNFLIQFWSNHENDSWIFNWVNIKKKKVSIFFNPALNGFNHYVWSTCSYWKTNSKCLKFKLAQRSGDEWVWDKTFIKQRNSNATDTIWKRMLFDPELFIQSVNSHWIKVVVPNLGVNYLTTGVIRPFFPGVRSPRQENFQRANVTSTKIKRPQKNSRLAPLADCFFVWTAW